MGIHHNFFCEPIWHWTLYLLIGNTKPNASWSLICEIRYHVIPHLLRKKKKVMQWNIEESKVLLKPNFLSKGLLLIPVGLISHRFSLFNWLSISVPHPIPSPSRGHHDRRLQKQGFAALPSSLSCDFMLSNPLSANPSSTRTPVNCP